MPKTILKNLQKNLDKISKKYSTSSSSPIMKKKDEEEEDGFVFTDIKKTTASSNDNVSSSLKSGEISTSTTQNTSLSGSGDKTQKNTPASELREGALIKNRVSSALEEKLGIAGAKKIIDQIDDAQVEKSVPVAKETVSRNISSGKISKYKVEDYPYMHDAFAVMYAKSGTGDKLLENNLYKLAYTQEEKSQEIQNNKANTKLSSNNTSPKLPYTSVYDVLKNALEKSTGKDGDSYYDFTTDGKGLDAELEPTPLEAANMVKYLSSVTKINGDKAGIDIGDWKWSGIYKSNSEGLDMGVFVKKVNGKITYVIINAGSSFDIGDSWNAKETKNDWKNNIQQPFGKSQDMKDSIEFAEKFVKAHPDANIVFVGHSKGGAEAAANAVATGKKAILFNPAKANFEAYDLNIDDYDSEMISYVVDGEILSKILAVLPLESPAKEVIIGEKGLLGKLYDTMPIEQILNLPDSVKNHLIDGVIKSLNETEEEKWKENLRYLLKIISPLLSWFV